MFIETIKFKHHLRTSGVMPHTRATIWLQRLHFRCFRPTAIRSKRRGSWKQSSDQSRNSLVLSQPTTKSWNGWSRRLRSWQWFGKSEMVGTKNGTGYELEASSHWNLASCWNLGRKIQRDWMTRLLQSSCCMLLNRVVGCSWTLWACYYAILSRIFRNLNKFGNIISPRLS